MVPNIKKILFLTDLSEQSQKALIYAASLANVYDAEITIFHAFEILSPNAALIASLYLGYGSIDEFAKKRETDIVQEIKDSIAQTCDEIGSKIPTCRFSIDQILVETGKANKIILQHIKKNEFDLLVMGSYSGIKEVILGGTAKKVIKHCQKPVLVVPLDRDI